MRPPQHPAAQAVLSVVAVAYGGLLDLRNRFYDRPRAVQHATVPVISVGNLTVGGTGKTPLIGWLARHLLANGHRPAVVSRGYGGRAGRGPHVVSRGAGATCSAAFCGDEPHLLAQTIPGTVVVVGADRVVGAAAAAREGADVVLLDDGFQHRRLARDLDLVLLDASNPFGNYRLLPAGLLRESVRGLGRADLVLITRSRPDERFELIERVVRHHNPEAPIVRVGHRPIGFFDADGERIEPPARGVVFCGIGNPNRFRIDVAAEGVEVVSFDAARDHHRYDAAEIEALRSRAVAHDAALITTRKDFVRLDVVDPRSAPPIVTMDIEVVVHDPQPLLAAVQRVMEHVR